MDKATTLYNAKVIRIVLSDPKQSQSAVSQSAPSPQKARLGKTAHRTVKKPVQTADR
jgi:hypothetical protein